MGYHDVIGQEAEKMLEYVETGTTDSAPDTMEVPASAYTDPAYCAREKAEIFMKMPLLAALTAEMPHPGDYKAMDLMGKPVLITRKSDGTVAAMLNVCSHRGMILKPEGHGNARRFSCPYHAWTYGNDGKLIGVAEPQKFGPVCKEERGLTQLPVAEAGGIIWVCLTPGLEFDIAAHLGGMLDDLEAYDLGSWHYCGSRRIYGPNWKIAYDGYLEGYHFAAAHPTTIHPRSFSNIMNFTAFGPHMRVGYPQVRIKEALSAIPRADWGEHENEGYDFVRTIFPNISIFFAPEITQVAQLIPDDTPGSNTTNLMFIRRQPPKDDADAASIESMMDWLRDVVNDEDYGVGLQVQKGLESGAIPSVIFGRNERGNQYFHKYVDYLQRADPHEAPPEL
ncbi:Rieske 2Fe-2S domain-containing protein [Sphingobium sp. AS12]|uniref:aromatic ring-hydroxylating oxygenase subunit alpha n=1 Tax=Sphingobium sp. AS12 TaxID=2849495 RepID=UPI001C31A870|nr:SRPBCC family protein [Sphingobium sp. AS12]MBV2150584.1 Rieske 2Fe-2S domain-containing protein [Sphingobium sp. AS12]